MANPEHVKILKQGVIAWNSWRQKNPDVKPDLCNLAIYQDCKTICATELNADKDHSKLITELMNSAKGVYFSDINFSFTNLNRSILIQAILMSADLCKANLQDTDLRGADLQRTEISGANLQRAKLNDVNFHGANISYSNFQEAILSYTNLQGNWLIQVDLQNAILLGSKLQGAELLSTKFQGANLGYAIVNGETWIDETAEVDRDTNFEGVALDGMRIDLGIKQLLEYNIRRKKWERWYLGKSKNKLLVLLRRCYTLPVRWFWWMSDYGRSTGRIIFSFFGFAFLFALIYRIWPKCVIVNEVVGHIRDFWHSLYFSVVTMTTLGFGDIAANPDSHCGQILLMIQVILGYILLGALVTRFAVLFTAGGPAAKFAKKTVRNNSQKQKKEFSLGN